MLPNADSGWALTYGPKKTRQELDGLIRFGTKLILIECKWKSPTLTSLSGDVIAALNDVDNAILAPLKQAQRARRWIMSEVEGAEFVESTTGRVIRVKPNEISEVYLVTLVGSGAWAMISANLLALTPLGLFSDGELPWALSINDLRVVAECIELPSQLFDYLKRRYAAQMDPRFKFHDEWDALGAYLAGALDVDDPQFANRDGVAFVEFDSEIQDYFYSKRHGTRTPRRPRRPLPQNLRELLKAVETATTNERVDAIVAILSWPNWGLKQLSKALHDVERRSKRLNRASSVSLSHPWRKSGVVFACGYRNGPGINSVLQQAIQHQLDEVRVDECVGFGIDLAAPWNPIVSYFARANSEPDSSNNVG